MVIPASAAKCKHRRTDSEVYKTKYIESTETHHIRKRYYKEVCRSCDKTLDRWTEEKEMTHRFDEDTCTKCGYEKPKEKSTIVLKNGSKNVYVNGEKTRWEYAPKNINGTTMVHLTIAVEVLGGEFVEWDSKVSQATVELNGETIRETHQTKKPR